MATFPKCSVIGCGSPEKARGFCRKHYKRWQRYGDTETVNRPEDWGKLKKNPELRSIWKGLRRRANGELCERWLDYWRFVEDVKIKPDGGVKVSFQRIDDTKVWGPENWYWRSVVNTEEVRKSKRVRMRQRMAKLRKANPDYFRDIGLRKLYGITLEEYNHKLDRQGHVCAICGRKEVYVINGKKIRLAVDHIPGTKICRGLLCASCNRGLGHFRDNPEFLEAAAKYLRSYSKSKGRIKSPSLPAPS